MPTRDRIIEAASRLIAERGYAATSLSDVAEASGVLKGNLAYYFPTKTDLLGAVLQARRVALWTDVGTRHDIDAPPGAVIGSLLDHVRATASDLARFGCPFGSLSTELGKAPETHPDASEPVAELLDFVRRQLERCLSKDEAQLGAEHILAVLQGAAVLAHARRDAGVVHRLVDSLEAWVADLLAPGR